MGVNFCPDCGARVVSGAKFCLECGSRFPRPGATGDAEQGAPSRGGRTEAATDTVISRANVKTEGNVEGSSVARSPVDAAGGVQDSVISRSNVQAGGAIEGSVVDRSDVWTERTSIKDTVISHSTIVQTETHQHFGESVGSLDSQMDLGRTAFEGKNWEEAVEFFNTALKMDARGFEPWFLKGLCCAELKRTDEAVTNLRRAIRLSGKECHRVAETIRDLVNRLIKTGIMQETQANELMGKARIEMQVSYNSKAGIQSDRDGGITKALALDLFVLPGLGSSMRTTSAVESLEKRHEADKREAEGRRLEDQAKEHLSEAVKHYNSAIRYCDLMLESQKEDEFSWMRRAEIFARLKLYDDAIQSYDALLAFNPYQREALRLRGMCFAAQGRPVLPPPTGKQTEGPHAEAPAAAQRTETPPAFRQVPGPANVQPASAPPMTRPVIPHQVVQYQTTAPAPQASQAPVMMPPVAPARSPQMAPLSQVPPPQPRPAMQPAMPPSPQAPPAARVPAAPSVAASPQGGVLQRTAPANPCPYCSGEMSFVREKGIWQCGSCRQFSARPAR
jgi:tetratricopeptide (TPR) repeat protein